MCLPLHKYSQSFQLAIVEQQNNLMHRSKTARESSSMAQPAEERIYTKEPRHPSTTKTNCTEPAALHQVQDPKL